MKSPRLVLLVAALLVPGCEKKSVEELNTEAAVPVKVEAARTEAITATIAASGVVMPAPGAELTVVAPAPARIAEMPKAEGDPVRQGDVLVRFDIPSLASDLASRKASVAQASARLDAARANLVRLSGLQAQGVAAPREVEDAKRAQAEAEADLEQARIGVQAAQALADRAVVRATFAGVIAKRLHNPGDLVDASASDPILKVINPAQLQIVASVPVADLPRVVVGRRASVTAPGGEPEAAKVVARAVQVDSASATATVRLAFASQTALAAGTTVQVDITAEEHAQAVVIPSAAVVRDEGETFVMVVGPDSKAHKYTIVLGLMTHDRVEVVTGLKAGERVITQGQADLPEGATVTIQQ